MPHFVNDRTTMSFPSQISCHAFSTHFVTNTVSGSLMHISFYPCGAGVCRAGVAHAASYCILKCLVDTHIQRLNATRASTGNWNYRCLPQLEDLLDFIRLLGPVHVDAQQFTSGCRWGSILLWSSLSSDCSRCGYEGKFPWRLSAPLSAWSQRGISLSFCPEALLWSAAGFTSVSGVAVASWNYDRVIFFGQNTSLCSPFSSTFAARACM